RHPGIDLDRRMKPGVSNVPVPGHAQPGKRWLADESRPEHDRVRSEYLGDRRHGSSAVNHIPDEVLIQVPVVQPESWLVLLDAIVADEIIEAPPECLCFVISQDPRAGQESLALIRLDIRPRSHGLAPPLDSDLGASVAAARSHSVPSCQTAEAG